MENMMDKMNELLEIHEAEKKVEVQKVREARAEIQSQYRDDVAKVKIKELEDQAESAIRASFNKMMKDAEALIEAEEQKLEGSDNEAKEIVPLELNNLLLKLGLFKDNEKALLKMVDKNNENKEVLDLIEDMIHTMDHKEELEKAFKTIEKGSDEAILENAKQIQRSREIHRADVTGIRVAGDISAYEVGNQTDEFAQYRP